MSCGGMLAQSNVQASINHFGQCRLRHTAWEFTGALPHGLSLEALSNCAPCCSTASGLCALQGRARQTTPLGERRGKKTVNTTCMHEITALSRFFPFVSHSIPSDQATAFPHECNARWQQETACTQAVFLDTSSSPLRMHCLPTHC